MFVAHRSGFWGLPGELGAGWATVLSSCLYYNLLSPFLVDKNVSVCSSHDNVPRNLELLAMVSVHQGSLISYMQT